MAREFKSQMYRIYEMRDEMGKGLDNLQKIITQQHELIAVLKKAEDTLSEDLKKFLKSLDDQLNKYIEQRMNMIARKLQLDVFIERFENAENKEELDEKLSDLFEALFK